MPTDLPTSPSPPPTAYTTKGFAALISDGAGSTLSERTIRYWCDTGKLPGAHKLGNRWLIPGITVTQLFAAGPPNKLQSPSASAELSAQDLAIVRGIAAGQSDRQIGRELHLAEGTIAQYVKRIRETLGANHRAYLVAIAKDQRLI